MTWTGNFPVVFFSMNP